MLVEEKNLLFLHIGKTGGSSIEHIMKEAFNLEDFNYQNSTFSKKYIFGNLKSDKLGRSEYMGNSQHASFLETKKIIEVYRPDIKFEELYKFTIIRNPIDRFISAYRYRKHFLKVSIDYFIEVILDSEINKSCSHFLPQHYYTHNNGKIALNNILRLENIDLDLLSSIIGKKIDVVPLLNVNHKIEKIRREDLQKKHLDKLYKVYAKDFELLNYT